MKDEARALRADSTRAVVRKKSLAGRWALVGIGSVLIIAAALVPWLRTPRAETATLSYTELIHAIDDGRVARLVVHSGQRIEGNWAAAAIVEAPGAPLASLAGGIALHSGAGTPGADVASAEEPAAGRVAPDFVVVLPVPPTSELLERAAVAGVELSFESTATAERYRTATTIALQLMIFGALFTFLFLHLRGQFGGRELGKEVEGSDTTFADVAGTQGSDQELREVVEFLRQPAAFASMGARVPKGVLLVGPPGTGKTLLARAVAGEAGVPFFQISGSEVTGFIVGLGAHRLRSLFKKARSRGGVVFIDEIDALGGRRGRNRSHNEDDRTLNQLLVEMDGFAPSEGVVVIGATNRADDLDPALKRPGRFDRIVSVGLPSADGREAILRLHAERRNVPMADDVDLRVVARLMPGTSGAELANLLNEAAIAAVREGSEQVHRRHFEAARDRLLLGRERVGFRAQDREWRIVAFHEAGHALAGVLCAPEDGLHKVTIQPRGHAMGVAFFSPDDDRHLYSRRYLEGQIIKGLAGRAAEELVFGAEQVTGGAENDLVQVNRIARTMIYRLGMGERTGFLVYDEANGPLSAAAQAEMDREVRELLERLYERTRAALAGHRPALDALAAALLERETLDGPEALALLQEHGVAVPPVPFFDIAESAALAPSTQG